MKNEKLYITIFPYFGGGGRIGLKQNEGTYKGI
jgi:hypothetical protein